MLSSRLSAHALRFASTLGVVALASWLFVASALAGTPGAVTVRVEGFNGATLLAQTQVTTTTNPIAVEGGVCGGATAGGALYDATHGDWKVKNDGAEGIEIDGIEGLSFPPFSERPDAYWSFWLNDEFAQQGACSQAVESGADIVFAAQCDALGPDCSSATAPDHLLTASAPTAIVVQVGTPVSVTIGSISTSSGLRETSLPANVTVTAGSLTVSPNASGVATLSLPAPGTYTVQAHAPDSIPSDPHTICVHNGNDGACGTQAPSGSAGSQASTGGPAPVVPFKSPFALVPRLTGLSDGHVYTRAHAPRIIAGSVLAHTAVASVSLTLRRSYRHRCYAFDGVTTRFVRARCGTGRPFQVASNGQFSYLLPSALAPGRYVLDIEATDAAGNRTTLARGTSRIVFYVR